MTKAKVITFTYIGRSVNGVILWICSECGAAVAARDKHKEWHKEKIGRKGKGRKRT